MTTSVFADDVYKTSCHLKVLDAYFCSGHIELHTSKSEIWIETKYRRW